MWFTILKNDGETGYQLHQKVWSIFPDLQKQGSDRAFCYRNTGADVYVLSSVEPCVESKKITVEAKAYLFEMLASTNRGTYRDENGKRRRMSDRKTEADIKQWLQNRLGDSANIGEIKTIAHPPHKMIRKDASNMVWGAVRIVGIVGVKDTLNFSAIIAHGLGQGAGFGLGAMLLPEEMKT